VGIETSDTANSFTSGSAISALEYHDPSTNVWSDWGSGNSLPTNGAPWTSSFSAGPYPGPSATFNRHGIWNNATAFVAYDAQTGNELATAVTGALIRSFGVGTR